MLPLSRTLYSASSELCDTEPVGTGRLVAVWLPLALRTSAWLEGRASVSAGLPASKSAGAAVF
jgi:hypothetical protein